MESGPDTERQLAPGPDPTPIAPENEAEMKIPSGSDVRQARDHLIALLDGVRIQYESSRINRIRYMRFARKHGMTNAEIGEYLGISEGGVRNALIRASDSR